MASGLPGMEAVVTAALPSQVDRATPEHKGDHNHDASCC